ncbi:MAG: GIDE domain-containing protein, partial [Steroidobacteraceae bacterium]
MAGGAAALRSLRFARLIEDMPTSRIRSAAQGYVELEGRALPLDGQPVLAPLTQRPCVWWRYRIQKKIERGDRRNRRRSWETVNRGQSASPFILDDGTGTCEVQPDGAEIVATEATTWYGATPWPAPGPAAGGNAWLDGGGPYRYYEERLYEHERIYALGDFRSDASAAEDGLHEQHVELLAAWKRDQTTLIARFDA